MSLIKLKTNGQHKALRDLYIRQNGDWVQAKAGWIKQNGLWVQVFPTPKAVPVAPALNTTVYKGYTDTQVLTITNSGNVPMKILHYSMVSTANFSTSFDFSLLEGAVLNPGEHKSIDVTFTGITVATETGSINFVADVGELGEETFTVTINAEVIPTYAQVKLDKKSISFTQTSGDPTASTKLVVTNTGNGTMEIYRFDGDQGIQIVGAPLTIPPFSSATVTVNNGNFDGNFGTHKASILLYTNSKEGSQTTIPVTTIEKAAHGSVNLSAGTSGYWQVPPGVYDITVYLVGGGGGGGRAQGNEEPVQTGHGGGSGSTHTAAFSVTPGQTFYYAVGAGGAGGNDGDYTGRDGGATTFDSYSVSGGGGATMYSPGQPGGQLGGDSTATGGAGGLGFGFLGQFGYGGAGGGYNEDAEQGMLGENGGPGLITINW